MISKLLMKMQFSTFFQLKIPFQNKVYSFNKRYLKQILGYSN